MKQIFFLWLLLPLFTYSQSITFDKLYTNGHIGYAVIPNSQGYAVAGNSDITHDYWLFQTDFYGNVIWEKHYGRQYGVYDITMMSKTVRAKDGGYFLAGHSFCIPDTSYWQSGIFHGYVVKTDSLGNMIWDRLMITTHDSSRTSRFNNVTATSDGGCLLTGNIYLAYSDTILGAGYGFYIVKLAENGEIEWEKIYTSGVDNSSLNDVSIEIPNNQGYFVAGRDMFHLSSSGLIMRLDINGDTLWTKTYPENNTPNDTLYEFGSIDIVENTNYAFGGASLLIINVNGDFVTDQKNLYITNLKTYYNELYASHSSNILGKFDNLGNEIWSRNMGYLIRSFAKTNDGGFIILTSQGLNALRLLKTDCEGNIFNPIFCTTSVNPETQTLHNSVFPNPTTGKVNLEMVEIGNYEVQILDIEGECLQSSFIKNSNYAEVNTERLSQGVYILSIKNINTQQSYQTKLLKK